MAYQPNIPSGTVPLNQDYLNIKGNFQSLNTQFLVDHVPLTDTSGTPPNGYHTVVHLVPFATNPPTAPPNYPVVAGVNGPTATVGYGQLFDVTVDDGINTDQALYYLSGGNRLTQFTRNFQPVASVTAGYSFLPGGLIIQWGTAVMNTTTNFPRTFKAGTVPVFTYGITNGGVVPTIALLNDTQFRIGGAAGSATWMAIGL